MADGEYDSDQRTVLAVRRLMNSSMHAVKHDTKSDSWRESGAAPSDVEKQYNLAPYGVPEGGDYKARFPNVDERKVIRKIDIRVVPVLCVLYLLAFLDR